MLRRFEQMVQTYPDAPPRHLPPRFFAFLWECAEGLRPHLLLLTLLRSEEHTSELQSH